MFEEAIGLLESDLVKLRELRDKGRALADTTTDEERVKQIDKKCDVFCDLIDRANLCVDILKKMVPIVVSEDWSSVLFPKVIKRHAEQFPKEEAKEEKLL